MPEKKLYKSNTVQVEEKKEDKILVLDETI